MSNREPRFTKQGPKRRRRTRRDGCGRGYKEGQYSQFPEDYTLPKTQRRAARSPKVEDYR